MKVEAGESLVLSWLRHVIGCQIVQLNWKPSVHRWGLKDAAMLEAFLVEMQNHFKDQKNRDIFNQGEPSQLIRQGEIDVLGLRRDDDGALRLFAVDIANHMAGLNLGRRDQTIARVLKKLVRSAASIHGFFPDVEAEVIFTTPKVDRQTKEFLEECIADLNDAIGRRSLSIKARLICNEEFNSDIVQNVVDCASMVADTSELFLRSIQLCQAADVSPYQRRRTKLAFPDEEKDASSAISRIPIGLHVQQQIRKLIDRGEISPSEIGRLLEQRYCSRTFAQSYPVLKWRDPNLPHYEAQHHVNGHGRYYAEPIRIGEQHYYLCSQWVERHRGPFDAWVKSQTNSVELGNEAGYG